MVQTKVTKSLKNLESIFYWGKTSFLRAKNLSVNTWTRHLFSYLWVVVVAEYLIAYHLSYALLLNIKRHEMHLNAFKCFWKQRNVVFVVAEYF